MSELDSNHVWRDHRRPIDDPQTVFDGLRGGVWTVAALKKPKREGQYGPKGESITPKQDSVLTGVALYRKLKAEADRKLKKT